MAEVHSEFGKIEIREDFFGWENLVAGTDASGFTPGGFRIIGDGLAEADSGITSQEADPYLNGVGRLTCTNEDKHAVGLTTPLMFKVGTMAPIVVECRFEHDDLDTKEVFIGLSDVNADDLSLEDDLVHGATTTITLTGSDLVGFLWSSELTDDEDLHAVYNGGTTTGATTSTDVDLDADLVAATMKIVRLEVDPNGTARWYVDGVLKKTVEGAVSTTNVLAAQCVVESKTTACETMDVDYFVVKANRDWTV
jgi:Arc/MetJ family transcription regulator